MFILDRVDNNRFHDSVSWVTSHFECTSVKGEDVVEVNNKGTLEASTSHVHRIDEIRRCINESHVARRFSVVHPVLWVHSEIVSINLTTHNKILNITIVTRDPLSGCDRESDSSSKRIGTDLRLKRFSDIANDRRVRAWQDGTIIAKDAIHINTHTNLTILHTSTEGRLKSPHSNTELHKLRLG